MRPVFTQLVATNTIKCVLKCAFFPYLWIKYNIPTTLYVEFIFCTKPYLQTGYLKKWHSLGIYGLVSLRAQIYLISPFSLKHKQTMLASVQLPSTRCMHLYKWCTLTLPCWLFTDRVSQNDGARLPSYRGYSTGNDIALKCIITGWD